MSLVPDSFFIAYVHFHDLQRSSVVNGTGDRVADGLGDVPDEAFRPVESARRYNRQKALQAFVAEAGERACVKMQKIY